MKKIKWKVVAFVSWVLMTFLVIDACFEAVNKANTIVNIMGILGINLWILISVATNCLTFKNKKDNEKKDKSFVCVYAARCSVVFDYLL